MGKQKKALSDRIRTKPASLCLPPLPCTRRSKAGSGTDPSATPNSLWWKREFHRVKGWSGVEEGVVDLGRGEVVGVVGRRVEGG